MKNIKSHIITFLLLIIVLQAPCIGVELEETSVIDGKVQVLLPKSFNIMSDEMLTVNYPSDSRPTLVYTNEDNSINFTFDYNTNKILNDDMLDVLLPVFVNDLNSSSPQIQWIKNEIVTINNKNSILLEYIITTAETEIYNLINIKEIEGKFFKYSFNCLESQRAEWELKAKQSLNSIEVQ